MTNPVNPGWFGQRYYDSEIQSAGGVSSWATRQKKPDEIERLKRIGAIGGQRGGGPRYVKRGPNIIH